MKFYMKIDNYVAFLVLNSDNNMISCDFEGKTFTTTLTNTENLLMCILAEENLSHGKVPVESVDGVMIGRGGSISENTVHVHIENIRNKLQDIFDKIGLPSNYKKHFINILRRSKNREKSGYFINTQITTELIDGIPNFNVNADISPQAVLVDMDEVDMCFELQYIVDQKNQKLIGNRPENSVYMEEYRKSVSEFYKRISKTEYSHLILVDEGGMGKSTFLKALRNKMEGYFTGAFYVSLSTLLTSAYTNPVREEQYRLSSTNYYIFREIRRIYGRNIENELNNSNNGEKILLLLDGYNELLERDNSEYHSFISILRDEIAGITQKYADKISVIIASRKTPEYAEIKSYQKCHLTGIPKKSIDSLIYHFDEQNISEEVKKLLVFPLYFKFFSQLKEAGDKKLPNTKYELFELLHRKSYIQTVERKDIMQKDLYLFTYFVMIPHLAKRMELLRDTSADRTEIFELINELCQKKQYAVRIISAVMGEDYTSLNLPDSPKPIMDFISSRFEFRDTEQKESFFFMHQELREYFAAFAVIYDLKTLEDAYEASALEDYELEFNLKTGIQKHVLAAFEIEGDKTEENYEKLFKAHKKRIVLKKKMPSDKLLGIITNEIRFAFAAFSLEDHFMLHLDNKTKVHEVIHPIAYFCTQNTELILSIPLSDGTVNYLLDIFSGEAHYYRNTDLSECRRYIECAKKICPPDHRKHVILNHQKAKALIQNAQNIYCKKNDQPDYYESKIAPDLLFKEGIELLEDCSRKYYNMSANLVCRMYSAPCMWMIDNGLIEINCKKAFDAVYHCFEKITTGYTQLSGTELVYMARLLVLMMISHIQLDENNESYLKETGEFPNEYTLKYLKTVFEKTDGQYVKHFGGAKALSYFLLQEFSPSMRKEEAAVLFKREIEYIIPQLSVLLFYVPYDKEFEKYFTEGNENSEAYDSILNKLMNSLEKMKFCQNNGYEYADDIYCYIDIKKIICMAENENNNRIFNIHGNPRRESAFNKLKTLIKDIDSRCADTFKNFSVIMNKFDF